MKAGEFSISSFDINVVDVVNAQLVKNQNGDGDVGNIESMINFYQLRQVLGRVDNVRCMYSKTNESQNIERIIDKLEKSQIPVLMTINLYNTEGKPFESGNSGGHAVVAYRLEEIVENKEYIFYVYDCTGGNGKEYPVMVSINEGIYSAKCTEWEKMWQKEGYRLLYFKSALTVDELMSEPILVAPNTLNRVATATSVNDEPIYLHTNYSDFTISNGFQTATIENCEIVDGNLCIEYWGPQNEPGYSPEYLFELPILTDGTAYIIKPTGVDTFETTMYYDDVEKGFFVTQTADKEGVITISSSGKISTAFVEEANFTVSVANNQMETPWYYITISGTNKSVLVDAQRDKTIVQTQNPGKIDVKVEADINYISMEQIDVDADGTEISSGEEQECVISKNGEEILKNTFGYSVVFDSQLGTQVEELIGVESGSFITEPMTPKRDGYCFEGWYKEPTCENLWDFQTDCITEDTILYAGWSSDPNYFVTVTFKIPGKTDQVIYIPRGSKIEAESCPKLADDVEQTWYLSNTYDEKWDFDTHTVTKDTILYAAPSGCMVVFESDGEIVGSYEVFEGNLIVEIPSLEKVGYTLCGWSTDVYNTKDWNFTSDEVTEDVTLYARWIENEKDKEQKDTGICIEIVAENTYVYTGKKITPTVIVRDGNKILQQNKDYKVSYKNNVKACDIENVSIKDNKKPQIIIQGIGAYKTGKKFVKYFSIQQADMTSLNIILPSYVAVKAKNKLQKIKPVVETEYSKVATKEYDISYYMDENLTEQVQGITLPGTYYVVLEAKKNSEGVYTGNCKGISCAKPIIVLEGNRMVSKAKVSVNKNVQCGTSISNSDTAIRAIISKIVLDSEVYKTEGDSLKLLKQYFEITAVDTNGTIISQDKLHTTLNTAGIKTIIVQGKDGNEKGYVGEKRFTINVKGQKIKKNQFTVTYDATGEQVITATDYTGSLMIPKIISELRLGTDYKVTYLHKKQEVMVSNLRDVGTYTAVISGIGQYTGSVSFKFSIKKKNLADAYAEGKLNISSDMIMTQNMAGAKMTYAVTYDADAVGESTYKPIRLVEGTDYTVSYKDNTKITTENTLAYGILKGTGNYTGTLKGDGKPKVETESTKKGIAKELNYIITPKLLSSEDITVVVNGIKFKQNAVDGVKYTVYDNGKKVSAKEYEDSFVVSEELIILNISASGKNYEGSRQLEIAQNLIKVSDKQKVRITLSGGESKYYYTGITIHPQISIVDENGQDISAYFDVEYGENVNVGLGTVKVTGKSECGYCGTKKMTFTILPKWMQWMF